jgi:hypothetical protein
MRVIATVALATVTICGAHAQTATKPTVKDLLAACDSGDQTIKSRDCLHQITEVMAWGVEGQTNMGYKAPGSPILCWPISKEAAKGDKGALLKSFKVFDDAVVAWLKTHPEELSKDGYTGIMDAAAALYQCGRF